MAIFNITAAVIGQARNDIYDRTPRGTNWEMVEWLQKNVGEYIGRGDGNVTRIGYGWEMFTLYNGSPIAPQFEDADVTYHLDITDEVKSTLFALKWTK
jgi:hypothetical protein